MKASAWFRLLPLALLAGCGGAPSNEAADDSANAAVARGPMLGAVDLALPLQIRPEQGAGWRIDLAPGRILYQPAGAKPVPFYPVSPRMQDGAAVYPTQTPTGEAVTITLRAGPCGSAQLRADVSIGARRLSGCGFAQTIEEVHRAMYNEALAVPYNAD